MWTINFIVVIQALRLEVIRFKVKLLLLLRKYSNLKKLKHLSTQILDFEGLYNKKDSLVKTCIKYVIIFMIICIHYVRFGNILRFWSIKPEIHREPVIAISACTTLRVMYFVVVFICWSLADKTFVHRKMRIGW